MEPMWAFEKHTYMEGKKNALFLSLKYPKEISLHPSSTEKSKIWLCLILSSL